MGLVELPMAQSALHCSTGLFHREAKQEAQDGLFVTDKSVVWMEAEEVM
jgi:hypothetical protein